MERLTRRELMLGAGALALGAGAADALAMPARDPGWGIPTAPRRAGGGGARALRELARRVGGPAVRPGTGAYARAAPPPAAAPPRVAPGARGPSPPAPRVHTPRSAGRSPDAVVEPLDTRDVQ